MDTAITPEDEIDSEHFAMIMDKCDLNDDGVIDACELHECFVECENDYRALNCVDYGEAFCDCPFAVSVCEGAWNCYDVAMVTDEVIAQMDTNGDENVNFGDNIDAEHLDLLLAYCDTNTDASLNVCELHSCVTMCENEWRTSYCTDSADLFCKCPYEMPVCEDTWNCEDAN
jgi:hypothetical protein